MFIRKKPNMSGTVSVQVVQKTKSRKQRVLKSLGSAHPNDTASLEKLMQQASSFIQEMEGPSLTHIYEEEEVIDGFVSSLNNAQVQVASPELVFGTLYDRIGYGAIRNRMFRNIVICRLFNPGSKLKTVDYMERYLHVTYSVDQIYRFLDNLCYRKEAEEKSNDVRKPETAEGEGGAIVVTYEGRESLAYVLGKYTVIIDGQTVKNICWSHDGEETSGGLEASAWGKDQLDEIAEKYLLVKVA